MLSMIADEMMISQIRSGTRACAGDGDCGGGGGGGVVDGGDGADYDYY